MPDFVRTLNCFVCAVAIVMIVTPSMTKGVKVKSQEQLIQESILFGYNIDVRPEEAHGQPLHVKFDIKLQKIVRLDVKHQEFIVTTFVRMKWRDPSLAWNISHFEEIDRINVGVKMIWTPDIVLYNAANENSFAHTDVYKTKALLASDGTLIWTAPVTWRVSCSFDVTWFPIDRQICYMRFGSWSYMDSQLEITLWDYLEDESNKDTINAGMIENGEWDITGIEIVAEKKNYTCCPDPFSNILYTITLNRMYMYYVLYIILPLISQILVFFMIFHIPFEHGERMGFGVTILLGITVYLLVISEKLPEKSDDLPMLGLCFIAEFFTLIFALVMTAVISKLSIKTSRPPDILLHFCLGIKQCINGPSADDLVETIQMHGSSGYLHSVNESHQELTKTESTAMIESTMKMSKEERQEENNKKWHRICHHLDKLSFYLFGGLSIFLPIIIFCSLDKTMLGI